MILADLIPLGATGLPAGFENARFPAVYERAKQALAECARIDECKDWANKAEALASYFQQSKNEQMIKDCRRIQARAIERCGELLMEIKTKQGARTDKLQEGDILKFPTRESVATAAGLSEHQRKTALRVVSVPKEQRDATPGQKAMAFAMQWPETFKVGRKKKGEMVDSNNQFDKSLLSRARFVLRNSPMVEGDRYPRRCLDVMNGLISLTEAYELAQQDFKDREKKEREAKEIAAKRADLEACRSSIQ